MGFPQEIVEIAFYERQKEHCALCGKKLIWDYCDYLDGDDGAWQAHHADGNKTNNKVTNCVCLCINYSKSKNCHLKAHFNNFDGLDVLDKRDYPFWSWNILSFLKL